MLHINLLKATTVRALHPCDVCEGECETCIWAPFAPYRCDWCPDWHEVWASCEQCYEAHMEDTHPPHVPLPRVWWWE